MVAEVLKRRPALLFGVLGSIVQAIFDFGWTVVIPVIVGILIQEFVYAPVTVEMIEESASLDLRHASDELSEEELYPVEGPGEPDIDEP